MPVPEFDQAARRRGFILAIGEMLTFLSLVVRSREDRARVLYDVASTHNVLAEESLYLSLGYWEGAPKTLDSACDAMAALVARTAGFEHQDVVLDVGFGFGDQDLFWMEHHPPGRIVGLNLNPGQVDLARRRVTERDLQDRISFQVGSATNMPFDSETFDKVVALESAHHFVTRTDFFHEAYRVLRRPGRLVTADVLPLACDLDDRGLVNRMRRYERSLFAAWPRANWYARDEYERRLAMAGFENIEMLSIRQHVYPAFLSYLARRLEEPGIRRRVNVLHRRRWLRNARSDGFRRYLLDSHDYVIVRAEKVDSRLLPTSPP